MKFYFQMAALLILIPANGCNRQPDVETDNSVENHLPEPGPGYAAQEQVDSPTPASEHTAHTQAIEIGGYLVDTQGLNADAIPDPESFQSGEGNDRATIEDPRGFFELLRRPQEEPEFETGVPDTKPQSLLIHE